MQKLKENVTVGIVGGSDYKKITEQLGLVWFSYWSWVWVDSFFISLHRLTRKKRFLLQSCLTLFWTCVFVIDGEIWTLGAPSGQTWKGGAGGEPIEKKFPYVFSENGLVAFHVSMTHNYDVILISTTQNGNWI